jgi:hypothetical protein
LQAFLMPPFAFNALGGVAGQQMPGPLPPQQMAVLMQQQQQAAAAAATFAAGVANVGFPLDPAAMAAAMQGQIAGAMAGQLMAMQGAAAHQGLAGVPRLPLQQLPPFGLFGGVPGMLLRPPSSDNLVGLSGHIAAAAAAAAPTVRSNSVPMEESPQQTASSSQPLSLTKLQQQRLWEQPDPGMQLLITFVVTEPSLCCARLPEGKHLICSTLDWIGLVMPTGRDDR